MERVGRWGWSRLDWAPAGHGDGLGFFFFFVFFFFYGRTCGIWNFPGWGQI